MEIFCRSNPVFCIQGMDKVKPAVLLVGGGEGMGQLEEIVDAISTAVGSACQV